MQMYFPFELYFFIISCEIGFAILNIDHIDFIQGEKYSYTQCQFVLKRNQ